jgi:hypothetical protein
MLDDELLVDRHVDACAFAVAQDAADGPVRVVAKPSRKITLSSRRSRISSSRVSSHC